jgi:serine/threonine-protein kinase RsbW
MDRHSAFQLSLPAHPDSITCVRHVLEGLEGLWPISREELDDIQIATVEACTNVVLHAYRDRPAGLMEVHGGMHEGQAVVAVRDHGTGILPRTDSPGLGVGLPLIGALTDDLHIGLAPDGAHEVRMRFPHLPA